MTIYTDVSCQFTSIKGVCPLKSQLKQANVSKILAVQLKILIFKEKKQVKAIHLQIDNMTALRK